LLAVLWLAAALSAIAFSLAGTVRGEAERAATALDSTRAYFLATGAVDRAALYMLWAQPAGSAEGPPRYYAPWMPWLDFEFPSGVARVQIIPENARLNLNAVDAEMLFRLLVALGAEPERARQISRAIVDWRTPPPRPGPTVFDEFYLSQTPSFQARHASFEVVEELLLVQGVTPDLFHGSAVRDRQGRLVRRHGLKDCLSVYGATDRVEVNSAPAEVLAAIGIVPGAVEAIVGMRAAQPFRTFQQLATLGPSAARLSIGGASIFTLRATARARAAGGALSDLRRSVAATVKLGTVGEEPYTVLSWSDNVWVE
jgi:general secretion pathway protein K